MQVRAPAVTHDMANAGGDGGGDGNDDPEEIKKMIDKMTSVAKNKSISGEKFQDWVNMFKSKKEFQSLTEEQKTFFTRLQENRNEASILSRDIAEWRPTSSQTQNANQRKAAAEAARKAARVAADHNYQECVRNIDLDEKTEELRELENIMQLKRKHFETEQKCFEEKKRKLAGWCENEREAERRLANQKRDKDLAYWQEVIRAQDAKCAADAKLAKDAEKQKDGTNNPKAAEEPTIPPQFLPFKGNNTLPPAAAWIPPTKAPPVFPWKSSSPGSPPEKAQTAKPPALVSPSVFPEHMQPAHTPAVPEHDNSWTDAHDKWVWPHACRGNSWQGSEALHKGNSSSWQGYPVLWWNSGYTDRKGCPPHEDIRMKIANGTRTGRSHFLIEIY